MKKPIPIDLIVKELTDKASPSEQEALGKWLNERENNRRQYKQIRHIWKEFDKVYDDYEFDEAAARKKITGQIRSYQLRTRVIRARIRIGAAASIVFLIGLTYLLINYSQNSTNSLTSYRTKPNEVSEVILPDSTHVWLNEESQLIIRKSYLESQRKVWLTGEGYFEVRPDAKHPFKVYTLNTVTRVLGTTFHLRQESEKRIALNVLEGKVSFYSKYSLKTHPEFVGGEQAIYLSDTKQIRKKVNNDLNSLAWKTKELIFRDTPLTEVCEVLSHYYGKQIEYSHNDSGLSLTGSFRNESLEDVIATLTLTLDIKATNTQNKIVLHP